MRTTHIKELLRNGEGLSVEFKRCSGRIEHDVFETICAFLNRFGVACCWVLREGYNQPNENLTSDGMKILQVECSWCRGVIDRKKIDVVE